jgi:hypothetical protein
MNHTTFDDPQRKKFERLHIIMGLLEGLIMGITGETILQQLCLP